MEKPGSRPVGRISVPCRVSSLGMGKKEMPSAVAPERFEGEECFISRRAPELAGAFVPFPFSLASVIVACV